MLLCIVAGGLGRFQSQARNRGHSDAVTLTIRSVFAPVAYGFGKTSEALSEFTGGLVSANRLVRENRDLKSMELAASLYGEHLRRLEEEIKQLRMLVGLSDIPGKSRLPGSVTGYFPNESRSTIDVGSESGVKRGMPVVAAEGLYGYVQTVDRHSCQALLISSPQFKIMGKVLRDPPPLGFVQGQSTGAMAFEVVDAKSLPRIGDRVYTSGLSERIPSGIVIGEIVQVDEDEAYGSKRCQIFPGVQIGSVREVFILR